LQAVNKAQQNIANRNSDAQPDFIFVKTENRLEKIMLNEIVYIEGMRDYRRIHTMNKKVMTLQNFSEF
jgi:DNA-binding LytR/AlgR family response regulator